ncbi:hypothetical protein D3C77_410800 [compost metagenome]
MPGQQRLGFVIQLVLAAQLFENRLAQRRQVIQAFTQWRHLDRQDVEPVVQVGAKLAAGHGCGQVGGGRGNDPHVAAHHLVGAHRLVFFFLQHAQQFALQRQRHVADFVEKQGATLSQLQLARAAFAIGAGVGTRCGAKEFGFKQGFRNGGAVDADKRLVRP